MCKYIITPTVKLYRFWIFLRKQVLEPCGCSRIDIEKLNQELQKEFMEAKNDDADF